jgi:hypothetical protein
MVGKQELDGAQAANLVVVAPLFGVDFFFFLWFPLIQPRPSPNTITLHSYWFYICLRLC